MDLTFVDVAMQKIETRKELWEFMTVCKSQIQEWMQLLFSKVNIKQNTLVVTVYIRDNYT